MGPIRVAQLVSVVVTPHRFRTERQFWSYCGLSIVMRSSSDWVRTPEGGWIRGHVQQARGLTRQHNHEAEYGHSVDLVHAAVGAGHVYDVLDRVDGLPAVLTGPVVVAITAGGNNLINATSDPGFPGSLPMLREQMGDEIDDVLDALLAPDRFGSGVAVDVLWADFYDPSDGKGKTPGIGGFPITSQNILDFTAEIDERVTARGEHLVDLYGPFFGHGKCGGVPPPAAGSWLVSDCIHLTAIGEQTLADQFRLEIIGTHD